MEMHKTCAKCIKKHIKISAYSPEGEYVCCRYPILRWKGIFDFINMKINKLLH